MSLYEMRNTVAGRVAGTLAALALVFSLSFTGADRAQAQTAEELQAQIAHLTALIAELKAEIAGGTTAPSGDFNYIFNRNLTIGATGQDVLMLQTYLNRNAATQVATVGQAGGPGTETSYYGHATGAAVKKYQEMHRADILTPLGLVTGTVNFGSSTRSFMNREIANLPVDGGDEDGDENGSGTPGTGAGALEGDEADLSWSIIGESDISVDSSDQHAFTIEVEADRNGGDAEINRIDLFFSADEGDVRNYRAIERVTLEVDGREIGSLRTDRRSDWRNDDSVRFSGLNLVVRSGETLEIDVLLDVTDAADMIGLDSVDYRFVDAVGIVITDSEDNGATVALDDIEGLRFRFTKDSNSPSNSSLDVSSNRNNETLVITDVEVRNGIRGYVEQAQVEVTFTGLTGTDDADRLDEVRDLVSRFMLLVDGQQVDSINASSLEEDDVDGEVVTLTFDADDYLVRGGDRFDIEVRANFRAYSPGISAVQVTNLALAGYDEAADDDFEFGDPGMNTGASWAAVLTLTEGDIQVEFTRDLRATVPDDNNKGELTVRLVVTNETESDLEVGTLASWQADTDAGRYRLSTGVPTSVTLISGALDGDDLEDGAEVELELVFEYDAVYSSPSRGTLEITSIDGNTVSFTVSE